MDTRIKPSVNKRPFPCNFCDRVFTDSSNKRRHEKYRCHKNPDVVVKKMEKKMEEMSKQNQKTTDEVKQKLEEQTEMVKTLSQIVQKLATGSHQIVGQKIENKTIDNSSTTNNSTTTINNNFTINLTEKIDFVQALRNIYGWDEARAISHIKERISQNGEGDINLFCDIYLIGQKKNWPLIRQDKKTNFFLIKDNGKLISDPGGIEIFKNFKRNYTDTLIRLSTKEIDKVVDHNVGTPDFEVRRDFLMDNFDLGSVQNKIYSLCTCDHRVFIKQLSDRINNIEKKEEFDQTYMVTI